MEMADYIDHRADTDKDTCHGHEQRIEPIGRCFANERKYQYGAKQFREEIRPRHLIHLLHSLEVPSREENDTDIGQGGIDIQTRVTRYTLHAEWQDGQDG